LYVTAFVAILSKAYAHILRLTSSRLHDLVVSDWAARAVLRYRRLKNSPSSTLNLRSWRHPALALSGHAMVLMLGFVLVVPVLTGHSASSHRASAGFGGSVLGSSAVHSLSAPDMREVARASTLDERLAPATPRLAAVPVQAPVVAAPPAVTFKPPADSGGSGLAAIYAVFGNSPGLSWALRVANCESHYNPLAVNRSSGASGLFQFMPSTWNSNFPGWNIWDPYAQARAALRFYNAGRQSAWTCK
jgi:Transglycosylase SLT domain